MQSALPAGGYIIWDAWFNILFFTVQIFVGRKKLYGIFRRHGLHSVSLSNRMYQKKQANEDLNK